MFLFLSSLFLQQFFGSLNDLRDTLIFTFKTSLLQVSDVSQRLDMELACTGLDFNVSAPVEESVDKGVMSPLSTLSFSHQEDSPSPKQSI